VRVDPARRPLPEAYPYIPAVHQIERLAPDPGVTFLVGENGAGKSTLIEALAIASGFSAQGGSLNRELGYPGREERMLAEVLRLDRGRHRPRAGFFLRAESFFNFASVIDSRGANEIYGGRDLHEQSHGESFLSVAANRFGPDSLFIFDEPEAALSVTSQLAFIAIMHRSASLGSQFIVATHSPILLGYPGALVYEISEHGIETVEAGDTDPVRLTRDFLEAPDRFLRHLFAGDDDA
jgi:predicted ATPase